MGLLTAEGIVAGGSVADEILKGVDLTVEPGEIVSIIGPNGAGKSTLLKVIAGILRPHRGTVSLDGRPLAGRPPREISALGVAFVPQEQNIFPSMSVRENLEMGGFVDPRGARTKVDAILTRFPQLADKHRHAARTLSGGQRQILAMAMALMVEPKVLLLDEPSAGLAPLAAEKLYDREKTTFRSEVDQALRAKPDMVFVNGYTPDTTVMFKEIFKAGYAGAKVAPAFAVNQKFLDALPHEVTDGTYTWAPSPALTSDAYQRLSTALGTSDVDPYSCQTHDHVSLVCLAVAKAGGEASGTAVRDHVRKISQGGGVKVDSAAEGLKLLAQGREINYEGASGPCDFTDIGEILDCKFRFEQAEKGKFKILKVA